MPGVLNYAGLKGLFEILKMFYPPEGLCWAEPERGPIVFTLHFIGVGRGTGGFNFRGGNPPFWKPADVLFDGTGGTNGTGGTDEMGGTGWTVPKSVL